MLKRVWLALVLAFFMSSATQAVAPVAAQGGLELTAPYPSIVVDGTDTVTLQLSLVNSGAEGRAADLAVARAPEGWTTTLKSGGFVVRRVYVKPEDAVTLSLQLTPPGQPEPGTHQFVIEASDGGRLLSRLELEVTVEPGAPGSIALSGDFPVLGGSAGESFEFKVTVRNDTNEERDVALAAQAPEGWRVSFKPSFENTQVSSIRLQGGASKSLDIEVTAPQGAAPGEYPILVRASAGSDEAVAELRVVLIGSYSLELTTPSGRLNTTATAGRDRVLNLALVNTGSAEIVNLSLSARAPTGWEATFEPETLSSLAPQSVREVQLRLKPSAKAIAGDYVASLSARSPLVSASQQLRVTVETPPTLGIVGGLVIFAVLGVLFWLFSKYGRR